MTSEQITQMADVPKSIPSQYYDLNDSDGSCFVCQTPQYKTRIKSDFFGFPLVFKQCACGIIKQTPMPNQAFFEWFYNSALFMGSKFFPNSRIWGFYDCYKDEGCRMATSKYRFKKMSKFFDASRPLKILKIGPGTGTFLKVANDHGHEAIGCDISAEFVDYARKTYNARIDQGRFEHLKYQSEEFDVVLLLNVLENIPNQTEFYAELRRVLKPGGLFIFNFVEMEKNFLASLQKQKYFIFRPPICYAFTWPVLKRILAQSGFEPIQMWRDIRHLTLEKILTLLNMNLLAKAASLIGIQSLSFPLYAYPSKIVISRKQTS